MRKGVNPYEYMDCWKKMDEHQLPPNEAFFSKLTDCGIRDQYYQHAQNVWRSINLQKMRAYHKLYMMSMFRPYPPHILFFQSL